MEWDAFANIPFNGLASHTTSSGGVDSAPAVTATVPSNGAVNVPVDANIEVTFSEAVNATGSWFEIACASGTHTAVVTGGPSVFTLNPDVNFDNGETCTVTVFAG